MKQSLKLVILQIFSIILGFISVFWIASSIPTKEYAIIGIYNIISVLILVFSNTGLESVGIRNILVWQKSNKKHKIRLLITRAIILRFVVSILIFLPLIVYSYYISLNKFNSNYFDLFLVMGLLSIPKAINDSTILILKAFNKYFQAILTSYTINVFGKIIALILYVKYGFITYIYFIMLLPLLLNIPILYMLREYISFKGIFNFKEIKESLKESKFFAFSSYISYLFNSIDQLLVSIFVSAEFLGSFTLAKSLLSMSKTFIENIFDPMTQRLVKHKNIINNLRIELEKILIIKKYIFILSLILFPVIIIFLDNILISLNLDKYQFLDYFIIGIYFSQVLYIYSKVKYNLIFLFYPEKNFFRVTLLRSIISIFFMVITLFINIKLIFIYIIAANIYITIHSNILFKKYFSLK